MRIPVSEIVANSRYRIKVLYHKRVIIDMITGEKMDLSKVVTKLQSIDPDITLRELSDHFDQMEAEPNLRNLDKETIDDIIDKSFAELDAKLLIDSSGAMDFRLGNMPINEVDLAIYINSHRNRQGHEFLSKERLVDALGNKKEREKKRLFDEFGEKIKYDPALGSSSLQRAEEIMRLVCGKDYLPIHSVILKHIIWLVKKRFYSHDPQTIMYPIFVNFHGKMNTGKSTFVEALFRVIPKSLFKNENNPDAAFNDPRTYHSFMEKLVIVFGELGGMDKLSKEKFKNLIDMLRVSLRMLGFNKDIEGPNYATLIGTSNNHLRDLIKDGPDVRKWIEIPFYCWGKDEHGNSNKSYLPLQAYDYLSFWKSVDENEPCPLKESYKEFCKLASEVCGSGLDATDFFLKEYIDNNQSVLLDGPQTKTLEEIYDAYKKSVPQYRVQQQKFAQCLKMAGFENRKFNYGSRWQIPRRHECPFFTVSELASYKTSVDVKMTDIPQQQQF